MVDRIRHDAPVLVIGLGYALVARVVQVAKTQNISSIADFVAALATGVRGATRTAAE